MRDLRDVHDIQCKMYRRKPHTHPQFKVEKDKYFQDFKKNPSSDVDLFKWDEYWRQKMEEIFEESWTAKKQQLTIDLSQKGAFTSLNSFPESTAGKAKNNKNGKVNEDSNDHSSYDVLDERSKFKQENADTINSYLNEFETTIDSAGSRSSLKSLNENNSGSRIDSNDFTLADIFKDAPTQPLPSPSLKKDEPNSDQKTFGSETSLAVSEPVDAQRPSSSLATRDLPPSFDSRSEEGSESSFCSDLDVDNLMENPDFLQGLEEIDKELQNAVASNGKLDRSESEILLSSPLNVNSKEEKDKESSYNEDLKLEFVNILKMLFRVSKRLGPLGLSVSALYHRASEDLRMRNDTFPSLNSDAKSLLTLVDKKLNLFLKENLPQVQKAIYGEISERLQGLLDKIDPEHDKFQRVNIHSIAVATLGQEVSQVVNFIKNTLLYHGYTQFNSDDVMNIYMSVKASQLDMEKS